ncbi:MAG TPA: UDP-N-acetylglucosamine 2-epimerase (non-hydrolyzing) [Polyangiaceae bacterium]|nr:UDP-N-acetylglucosamine 2-epimerase (non-hydrolyzing) [Polyangiaceae bacterium]
MPKLKVVTVVGTRPEIIRLSRVIAALDEACDHVLVHTGQNYDFELNAIFFEDLGIRKPNHHLEAAGKTPTETIGQIMARADQVLADIRPDAALVLGDTNSALALYPAKRRRIPTFHMEAGNRCFDERVPEEINRRIVDHLSDINLPYSDIAREYLLREGFPAERIIKTGSPMFEVLSFYAPRIDASRVLERLGLAPQEYFVLSSHREENIDSEKNFAGLVEIINGLARTYGKRVIVSTHPRTRKRMESSKVAVDERVLLSAPLAFSDYVALERSALAVLSDSGTLSEEASILNFPALNLREAHERPEGMEEAVAILTGMSFANVERALSVVLKQPRGDQRGLTLVRDYSTPNVSEKVVRIILSYVDYVRRRVWRESP